QPADPLLTDEGMNTCVIVQTGGGTNKARCKLRDSEEQFSEQTCTVTQDGVRNSADIDMTIEQKVGPNQDGKQTATVVQTATERNQSQIHQMVKQQTSAGTTSQLQDGYQLADVQQGTTLGSVDNFSHVHQSQDQNESGNAVTQAQNTSPQELCLEKNANQCAHVLQTNEGGKNDSHLHQAIGERQSTTAASASQTQGLADNGNEGAVHQTNPLGLGENNDHAHQVLAQRQSGPNGTTNQTQDTDPRCCGGSQVGGQMNREDINQATTQSASESDASQISTLLGEVHQVSDPANSCRIDHHARNNSDSTHESVSGTDAECTELALLTECSSGGEGGSCTTTEPCVSCDLIPILSVPTSATFGRDIAMPNYTSEPADYTDPGGWW
ncbi:MAG: hypothetical protein QOD43_779, partial [Gaiellaceae bacterium]|nr:hypothetical protein [Gaiellaceae bacterium]